MMIEMLKSKLHRATVTQAELHYEGSIGIDRTLMDMAGLRAYEKVDVLNINNGSRFTTYVIEQPRDSGDIVINGAAARLAQPGDLVIIVSYASMTDQEADTHQPKVFKLDTQNKVKNG